MKGHDVIARSAASKTPLLRSEQAPQSPRGTKGDGCAVRDVVRGRARGDSIGRGQSPYPMILPEGRMDLQRHGASPNPYFLGIALWSTFGIMYVTGKCPGASFTILALEVKHRTA